MQKIFTFMNKKNYFKSYYIFHKTGSRTVGLHLTATFSCFLFLQLNCFRTRSFTIHRRTNFLKKKKKITELIYKIKRKKISSERGMTKNLIITAQISHAFCPIVVGVDWKRIPCVRVKEDELRTYSNESLH